MKSDWEDIVKKYPHMDFLSDVQSPGLIAALKEHRSWKITEGTPFPRELAVIMYDRYGLNPQVIEQVSNVLGTARKLIYTSNEISYFLILHL